MNAAPSALPGRTAGSRRRGREPRRPSLLLAGTAAVTTGLTILLGAVSASPASAATTISGPVGLGTAAAFSVLGASDVTNTGSSVLDADLGVSPGSSISGFPPGVVNGATRSLSDSAQAQSDTGTAYDVAASLSPTSSGLTDLVGLTLVPGVYSGSDLSLSGNVTLSGSASSVWVFQAANTLITSSASTVTVIGGATSCNVFWQVGSSATLGSTSSMVGTIMAQASISTSNGTTVAGRLLARTGGVTLINTRLIQPVGCGPDGTVVSSPTITSTAPTRGVVGRPYSFAVTSRGTGTTTYTVTGGGLAPGLTLNSTTGVISGTPTSAGTFGVTITADNGTTPVATASYRISVVTLLAETGTTSTIAAPFALGAVLLGFVLLLASRRRRSSPRHSV